MKFLIILLTLHCLSAKKSQLDLNSQTGGTLGFGIYYLVGSISKSIDSVVVTTLPTEIIEGQSSNFTIKLNSNPEKEIIISFTSDSNSISFSPLTVTFNSSNFSTEQTVSISVSENTDYYKNYTANVNFTSPTSTISKAINIIDNNKRMFVTSINFTGNLGGVSGADEKCNSDSNKPSTTVTFKALITDTFGNTRSAPNDKNIDWVLKPLFNYRRSDDALIFKTNLNSIYTDTNFINAVTTGTTKQIWTGLKSDWTCDPTLVCKKGGLAWTDDTGVSFGIVGRVGVGLLVTSSNISDTNNISCMNSAPNSKALLCVEQ